VRNSLEVLPVSLKTDKRRITAIISQDLELKIQQLSDEERRTKSSMTAILIEEAIEKRTQKGGNAND
jgi:hypothetical protein